MCSNNDRLPTVVNPRDLYYLTDNEKIPLPVWCLSLVDLGQSLARVESTVARLVIALSVPTRAFASVLIATGLVIENSTKQLGILTRRQHLKDISSLKPGTNVIYRDSKREFKGQVSSYDKVGEEQYIKIKIGSKDYKSFPLHSHASYITVSDKEIRFRDYQKVKSVKKPGEFIVSFLGSTYAEELVSRTELNCLIIGQLSTIRSEVIGMKIGLENSSQQVSGSLQEILRIKQFLNSDEPYRCSVIPSSYFDKEHQIEELRPHFVIYDSAHAFVKHNHNWLSTHCIVILDRTERSFTDAAVLLNQNYTNRVETKQLEFSQVLPDAIEAMIFQERY